MRTGKLEEAKEGDVVHFVYLQPQYGPHERLIKVLEVRDVGVKPIKSNSKRYYRRHDKQFKRARFLITGEDVKSGEIKSFYADEDRTSVGIGIL